MFSELACLQFTFTYVHIYIYVVGIWWIRQGAYMVSMLCIYIYISIYIYIYSWQNTLWTWQPIGQNPLVIRASQRGVVGAIGIARSSSSSLPLRGGDLTNIVITNRKQTLHRCERNGLSQNGYGYKYIYIYMHKIHMHVCCRYMVDIYNMSTFLSALFLILFVLAALHMTFRHA